MMNSNPIAHSFYFKILRNCINSELTLKMITIKIIFMIVKSKKSIIFISSYKISEFVHR